MFPKNSCRNEIDFLIFCHFDLWLRIKINHQKLRSVIFKYYDMAFLLSHFCNSGKILVCFCSGDNGTGI